MKNFRVNFQSVLNNARVNFMQDYTDLSQNESTIDDLIHGQLEMMRVDLRKKFSDDVVEKKLAEARVKLEKAVVLAQKKKDEEEYLYKTRWQRRANKILDVLKAVGLFLFNVVAFPRLLPKNDSLGAIVSSFAGVSIMLGPAFLFLGYPVIGTILLLSIVYGFWSAQYFFK